MNKLRFKGLVLLAALCFMLSLCACGEKKDKDTGSEPQSGTSQQVASTGEDSFESSPDRPASSEYSSANQNKNNGTQGGTIVGGKDDAVFDDTQLSNGSSSNSSADNKNESSDKNNQNTQNSSSSSTVKDNPDFNNPSSWVMVPVN